VSPCSARKASVRPAIASASEKALGRASAMATSGSRRLPASDERSATIAIVGVPATNPPNDRSRFHIPKLSPPCSSPPARLSTPSTGRSSATISLEYRVLTNAGLATSHVVARSRDPQVFECRSATVPRLRPALRGRRVSGVAATRLGRDGSRAHARSALSRTRDCRSGDARPTARVVAAACKPKAEAVIDVLIAMSTSLEAQPTRCRRTTRRNPSRFAPGHARRAGWPGG
jgi:hypothetical protein